MVTAQEKKSVQALYITTPLTIDGVIDEPVAMELTDIDGDGQLDPFSAGLLAVNPGDILVF